MSRVRVVGVLVVVLLTLAVVLAVPTTRAAVSYVVVVDLSHGQGVKGLDVFLKTLYDAEVYLIVPSKEFYDALSPQIRALATGYYVGNLAKFTDPATGREYTLTGIYTDLLIIPQPTKPIVADEVTAVISYLKTRGGGLWVAGDSDYGAGEDTIKIVNDFMIAIGANIVLDYLSIADPVSNCGADYRVVAWVRPPKGLEFLAYGAEKILMHGPGVVAFYNPTTGTFEKLTDVIKTRDDIKVIVWSSPNGTIVENNAKIRGIAYEVGSIGTFPMVVAQVMPRYNNAIVILSGETPVGGYQPMITAQYYLVYLDGPRFVRNIVLWASRYMGELKYVAQVGAALGTYGTEIEKLVAALTAVQNSVKSLEGSVKDLRSDVESLKTSTSNIANQLQQQVSRVDSRIDTLSRDLEKVSGSVKSLSSDLSTASTVAYVALALALVSLILSILRWVRR
ncbi:MAG: hypothetical protein LM571_05955 [Desulfurococcaceae archaeon]|nr:hypothetical protein [Desulfurococcaceae archaeon]